MYEQWLKFYEKKIQTELDDDGQKGKTNDKTKLISNGSIAQPQRLTFIPLWYLWDVVHLAHNLVLQQNTTNSFRVVSLFSLCKKLLLKSKHSYIQCSTSQLSPHKSRKELLSIITDMNPSLRKYYSWKVLCRIWWNVNQSIEFTTLTKAEVKLRIQIFLQ